MSDLLELDAGGWRRDGEAWVPVRPFYAVVGDPIAHSLSPVMQNAALQAREIDTEYLALHIRTDQLPLLKDNPIAEHLVGFNVTAPHKAVVSQLCDGRTDQARDLDAVNTVKVENGKWLGHNTDTGGIMTVAAEAWRDGERPERVVVMGAGGSARAAIDAMLRWGVPELEVRNRTKAGQEHLTTWLAERGAQNDVLVTDLADGGECASDESTLWICCLAGGVPCVPFLPVAAGERQTLLLDLRYGDQRPAETVPLGFEFNDGLPLLLVQGGLSFAWWCGPPVPWVAMRDALLDR